MKPGLIVYILLILLYAPARAQVDSTLAALRDIPLKYVSSIDKKVDQYSHRISSQTIKTLQKLSRWEAKVHTTLTRLSPATAEQLFGNRQPTFSSLLQRVKQGEAVALQYQQQYDQYRDELTTSLKYVEQQKDALDSGVLKKIAASRQKMQELNQEEDKQVAIQQFIKERKKELINSTFQYLGKSKYLSKINKEVWYYGETMKNYKELFQDEKKMEQTAKSILNKIPAFRQFLLKNSMLNTLVGQPGDLASAAEISNLQTRDGIGSLIGQRIAAGGPNAMQQVQQNIQMGQAELNKLKDKLLKVSSTGNGGENLPDFKVNTEKTKTFRQRLEYNCNLQFAKNNTLMPTIADIAVGAGYRLSAGALAGVQIGYKLGVGSLERIRFSSQGISVRSFTDMKLKGQLSLTAGFEMNYLSGVPAGFGTVKYYNGWQKAAVAGVSKKLQIKTKWIKETKLSLLYDFLANQHLPGTPAILFRVGYNF